MEEPSASPPPENVTPTHIGVTVDQQECRSWELCPPNSPEAWQPGQVPEGAGPGHHGDDTPETDPEDNEDDEPPETLPPPELTAPPGYDQSAIAVGAPLPPPAYSPLDEESSPLQTFTGIGTLNEQQVRDAICAYADQHCCYGIGVARSMTFDKLEASSVLHYQLETFTETRSTSWHHKPLRVPLTNDPHRGPSPAVWDIECEAKEAFKTHDQKLAVPHSSNVKVCYKCTGFGKIRCPLCDGRGRVQCWHCNGTGRSGNGSLTGTCSSCAGSRKKSCYKCSSKGRITCPVCDGFEKLKWSMELKVKFTNNVDDFIHKTTDLPSELIKDVSGKVILEQTLPYIYPISQCSIGVINENSIRLVERHRTAWPDSRILQQRQVLHSVPVTEVHYTYNDHKDRFWVYGNENRVFCLDYPQMRCWGCTIL